MEMSISRLTKRNLLYANVSLFRFLVSVEYAIIIPTLWPYLSNVYGSSSFYYGLCLSGFHMTALPSSILFGFLNDFKLKLKTIVLFGNVLQVVDSALFSSVIWLFCCNELMIIFQIAFLDFWKCCLSHSR